MIGRSLAAQSQEPMKLTHENGSQIFRRDIKLTKYLPIFQREGTYKLSKVNALRKKRGKSLLNIFGIKRLGLLFLFVLSLYLKFFIHSTAEDIWVASSLELLWIFAVLYTPVCGFCMYIYVVSTYPGVELIITEYIYIPF